MLKLGMIGRSLLFAIFLLLFLLLPEHILLEDLPQLAVLRGVLVECLVA